MSTAHKPLNVKAYDTKSVVVSEEQKYWEQLSKVIIIFILELLYDRICIIVFVQYHPDWKNPY